MPGKKIRNDITKEILEKYLKEGMSIMDISMELHANYGTITRRIKEYGLQSNPRKNLTKCNKKLLQQYLEEGKTYAEMSKLFGVRNETLRRWIRMSGLEKREEKPQERKCPTCIYRSPSTTTGNCDYIGKTGQRRGCPADNCAKYTLAPQKRKEKKNDIQKS